MGNAKLPERYEIRPLEPQHLEWAKALFAHSFVFGSPIWRNLYPADKTARFYGLYAASNYLIRHQISSGLSLGIFDTEYEFKNSDSVSSGGALYFDFEDTGADEDELLRQMDTPLVSIACAFDAFHAMDGRYVAPVMGRLPASASFYEALCGAAGVRRDDDSDVDSDDNDPTAPGQVVQRMGTATRADATRGGFMKAAAHDMMRRAADAGYQAIRIFCSHDAVTTVWTNPPPPFAGRVTREANTYTLGEVGADGRPRFPFRPVKQRLTKVSVALR